MAVVVHHPYICSLIHKKWHPKSDHSDIKYRMTLNMIFKCRHMPMMTWKVAQQVCPVESHT